ncbi:hypothetical protein [Paenibacillus turpanensis]|uniref:arsenate reductase/protein-tyrosine-phosphatase family protein n=1 Tax=Paenibacillus turpanensis TaxID=2689078 RepID=UPI00140BFF48|nr:hypothetical protein [Paenibacillus turpanensis]
MHILFLCTDNFTRSIIAEYCLKHYIEKHSLDQIAVSSAGIRATSDVSKYSKVHFEILKDMGIDASSWGRTPFQDSFFEKYDFIIGMSELHREYIREHYQKDIYLFNELYKRQTAPVNIGSPDSEDFEEQMKLLVNYIHDAMPELVNNILEKKHRGS